MSLQVTSSEKPSLIYEAPEHPCVFRSWGFSPAETIFSVPGLAQLILSPPPECRRRPCWVSVSRSGAWLEQQAWNEEKTSKCCSTPASSLHPPPPTEWPPAQSSGAGNQAAPLPPPAGPSEPQSLSGSQPHKNLRPPLALGRHREREADAGPEADPSLAPERIQMPKSASTEPGGQVPL